MEGINEPVNIDGLNTANWAIVSGCERLTEGCDSCPSYWEYMAENRDYSARFHTERLNDPINNKTPTRYVVALGSDLFHESVKIEELEKVFETMIIADWHFYELTTKRIERCYTATQNFTWPKNISMGVSVESGEYKWRINYLRKMAPIFKVISIVPLLAPMGKLDLYGIAMVGVQPETWGLKRECKKEWIDEIELQCKEQGVLFHMESNILINGEIECPVQ